MDYFLNKYNNATGIISRYRIVKMPPVPRTGRNIGGNCSSADLGFSPQKVGDIISGEKKSVNVYGCWAKVVSSGNTGTGTSAPSRGDRFLGDKKADFKLENINALVVGEYTHRFSNGSTIIAPIAYPIEWLEEVEEEPVVVADDSNNQNQAEPTETSFISKNKPMIIIGGLLAVGAVLYFIFVNNKE